MLLGGEVSLQPEIRKRKFKFFTRIFSKMSEQSRTIKHWNECRSCAFIILKVSLKILLFATDVFL